VLKVVRKSWIVQCGIGSTAAGSRPSAKARARRASKIALSRRRFPLQYSEIGVSPVVVKTSFDDFGRSGWRIASKMIERASGDNGIPMT
jgi:hypothetical protein